MDKKPKVSPELMRAFEILLKPRVCDSLSEPSDAEKQAVLDKLKEAASSYKPTANKGGE